MAFCIFHQYCPVSGDNGHCTVFVGAGRFARGVARCPNVGALPEDKWAAKKETFVRNALKESKMKAAGK